MDFFFSDQTAQDKEKQRKIKYILHKYVLEHSAVAKSDSGDQIGQWSLDLRANDLIKDRFWHGSSIVGQGSSFNNFPSVLILYTFEM